MEAKLTHDEKVRHLRKALSKRGVWPFMVAPPIYRLLWRLGLKVRPPLFQSFFTLFLDNGTFFVVVMWVLTFSQGTVLDAEEFFSFIIPWGAFVGLVVAIHIRWKARRLGLPSWKEYPGD